MSKTFAQAPKPPSLSADVISAFERGGTGQDTRSHIPSNVELGEPTTPVLREPTKPDLGETTKVGKEPTRRLSIDLPQSWHRRFKTACSKTDKKMLTEVMDFIKRRTVELEKE
jgi:hypothetical protein